MQEENRKSSDNPFEKTYEENPFENLFDFYIIQQIFIQLTNQIKGRYFKRLVMLKKYKKQHEMYSLFSLVCTQFNLVSRNTLFNINFYQNEIIIQNIKYPIYLKLNYANQREIILENKQTQGKTVSKQEYLNRLLFFGSESRFYDLIKPLTEYGADTNYQLSANFGFKTNCLSQSCKGGYLKTTKKLVKYGANINWKDCDNNTLLHFGCNKSNLKLVKYLLELGLNLNTENNHNQTPVFTACQNGNLNIVKYIISLNIVDIHHQNIAQHTILYSACESKNLELIQYLLDLKLDINHISSYGKTCFHIACYKQRLELVKLLILNGADLSIEHRGKTCLDIVKSKQEPNPELIKELEKNIFKNIF